MIRRVCLTRVPVTGSVSISVCVSVIALCFSLACGLIDVPWRRSKGAPGDGVTALATAVKAVMEKYGVSSLATADSTVIGRHEAAPVCSLVAREAPVSSLSAA